jgi:hypothetical protein
MQTDVQRFVEALINRYGIWRVILAPYGLVPVLGALGVVFDRRTAALLGTAGAIFVSFLLVVWLSFQLHRERACNQDQVKLINSYVDLLLEDRPLAFEYDDWEEYVTVGRNGDTTVEQFATLRVTEPAKPMSVFWVALYQSAGPLLSDTGRRRVVVTADRFTPVGPHDRKLGARCETTQRWEAGNRLRLVVHLTEPLELGDLAHLHLHWTWPGFYRDLVGGGRDVIEWTTKVGARSLRSSVTFNPECMLPHGLEIVPYAGTPAPRYHRTGDGRIQIDLSVIGRRAGDHSPLGLHLDASRNRQR